MNEVRDENSIFTVRKQCKEVSSCASLQAQNPSQCHRNSEINSLCHYCCDIDLCNHGNYLDATTEAQPVTQTVTNTAMPKSTVEITSTGPTTTVSQLNTQSVQPIPSDASTTVSILPLSTNEMPCVSGISPYIHTS